ncbi:tight adherence pilus pseudopilin TadF [Vibrio bivalvicida]|uniref:Tight adherence pilus pseudopilin TadF n=1 Tax=Vibrio bivalvicida TaxID=1276888 RepID=A0ABV4MDU4_9VIBR
MTAKIKSQQGATVVEFPFVVLGIMVIVFGLVSIYRLMYVQTRMDSSVFMVADAVSRTFEGTQSLNQYSAEDLLEVAARMLPTGFERQKVGVVLDIYGEASNTPIYSVSAGSQCQESASKMKPKSLIPVNQQVSSAFYGREATLIKLHLCVLEPFNPDSRFTIDGLVLPRELSSNAVMIGRHYAK